MELNFVDEDCGSFVISSKSKANSEAANSKGVMTEEILSKDKSVETRGEMKEFSEQCEFEAVALGEEDYNKPDLLKFLKTRLGLFDSTFREQKIIENTIGNISLVTFPCLKILTERGYWS